MRIDFGQRTDGTAAEAACGTKDYRHRMLAHDDVGTGTVAARLAPLKADRSQIARRTEMAFLFSGCTTFELASDEAPALSQMADR